MRYSGCRPAGSLGTPDRPYHYPATFIAGGGARSAAGSAGSAGARGSVRPRSLGARRAGSARAAARARPRPFSPPEPQVLQEGEGRQAQERVVVQAAPAPALEVVEPELVLGLLVQLLADPPGLDQRRQGLERGVGREVGQVVLLLAGGPVPADQPGLVPGQV